ncbi:hypothetical protein BLOT_007233 [Blomia tropicalis]|nr:hypothetical protein BLOT_007233 [Blomia tropicalis]
MNNRFNVIGNIEDAIAGQYGPNQITLFYLGPNQSEYLSTFTFIAPNAPKIDNDSLVSM